MGIAFPKRPQTFVVFTPLANGHFSVLNGFDHGGNTSDCADVMDGGTLMMAAQSAEENPDGHPIIVGRARLWDTLGFCWARNFPWEALMGAQKQPMGND